MSDQITHLPILTDNNPNFIGVWSLSDITVNDLLIDFFNTNQTLHMDMSIATPKGNKIDEDIVKGKSILNLSAEDITNTLSLIHI